MSPQHAPERIAPAISAGLSPIVVPIAINAIPKVADTVQAEPRAIPTTAHITVTKGKNTAGVNSLSP